jgi:hypothetical protein
MNYKPNGNFTLRDELRYDWYTGPARFVSPAVPGVAPNQPFGDNASKKQFLFGLAAESPTPLAPTSCFRGAKFPAVAAD